jgi:2-polyprenyl-3-methyl-5-hydroxy-6-metoxy-1,4-benzoquinol methylase
MNAITAITQAINAKKTLSQIDVSNTPEVIKTDLNLERVSGILPKELQLVKTKKELEKLQAFRKDYCDADRPGVCEFQNDGRDEESYVLYGTDEKGAITSSARLLPDSEKGFPEEQILPASVHTMRQEGKKLAELGRLVITEGKTNLLRQYYKAIYDIATLENIDVVLIVMKQRNISSHKKIMAVTVLSDENMGFSWDEEQAPLCLVAWEIKAKQPKLFYKWIDRDTHKEKKEEEAFSQKEWDEYSPFHLGVMTSVQHEVYQHIPGKVHGNVLDLGCGSGRIMAFMQNAKEVQSYTGVDASEEMIHQASWLKQQLGYQAANLVNARIEDIDGKYDSIVSIHSFYSWDEPDQVLSHIYDLLSDDGVFVLVTPNNRFNVEELSNMVKRELLGHPYYEQFLTINYSIANKAQAQSVYQPMDTLIDQVRRAGFCVNAAHNEFFLGGASYLELTKSA